MRHTAPTRRKKTVVAANLILLSSHDLLPFSCASQENGFRFHSWFSPNRQIAVVPAALSQPATCACGKGSPGMSSPVE
jgi:hypothetical protein